MGPVTFHASRLAQHLAEQSAAQQVSECDDHKSITSNKLVSSINKQKRSSRGKRVLADITNTLKNEAVIHDHKAGKVFKTATVTEKLVAKKTTTVTEKLVANITATVTEHPVAETKTSGNLVSHESSVNEGSFEEESITTMSTNVIATVNGEERVCEAVMDIDKGDVSSCLKEAKISQIIFDHLRKREKKFMVDPDYMKTQPEITAKMRAVLLDWLVDVHLRFQLRSNTLFLTTQLIDRYLEHDLVERSNLQLVGITATFISSKYEEIFAPRLSDFVHITDNAYTEKEIIRMEVEMLSKLDFSITAPSALTFLRRHLKASATVCGAPSVHHAALSRYLIELALIRLDTISFRPSMIAAAACKLAAMHTRPQFVWNVSMQFHCSGWSELELEDCEERLASLLECEGSMKKDKLTAVHRKFSSATYSNIATLAKDFC